MESLQQKNMLYAFYQELPVSPCFSERPESGGISVIGFTIPS
jgi:hypothetical protein